jgi:hypothetical protein
MIVGWVGVTTLVITTFSINNTQHCSLDYYTQQNNLLHNGTQHYDCYTKSHHFTVILNVASLDAFRFNVIIPNVVILNVVAPFGSALHEHAHSKAIAPVHSKNKNIGISNFPANKKNI